jgi:FixJ family two-component response regulator
MSQDLTIFLVDDDTAVLVALSRLLSTAGFPVRSYSSPRDFLDDQGPDIPGVALIDVAMPGLDGLALQDRLADRGIERPIVFITGEGDIPTSVRAMKAGAVDFLTKPIDRDALLAAIGRAATQDRESRARRADIASVQSKLALLTPREREVLTHVIAGRLNKQIAYDLGTVEKTIKVHRARMMQKLGVRNVADLMRMVAQVGI